MRRHYLIFVLFVAMVLLVLPVSSTTFDGYTQSVLYFNGTSNSTTIIDEMGSVVPWTASGIANISTGTKLFGSGSLFNSNTAGTEGSIRTTNSTFANFGTGDFTIEASIYPTSIFTSGYSAIMCEPSTSTPEFMLYDNVGGGTSGRLNFYDGTTRGGSTQLSFYRWWNVSVVRSSGNLTLYVEGISNGSFADSNEINFGAAYFGKQPSDARFNFRGYIDNVRISNTARYTGNYVPTNVEWGSEVSPPAETNSSVYLLPTPQLITVGSKANVTLSVNNLSSATSGILANVSFNKTSVSVTNVYINSSVTGATLISTVNNTEGFVNINITKTYLNASVISPVVDIQFTGLDATNITVPLNFISNQYVDNTYNLINFKIIQSGTLSISDVSLSANFVASNSSGTAPLLVSFTDTSTNINSKIDNWNWSFDDGEISSDQNPAHIFNLNKTHVVNLTITNSSHSLISTKLMNITVFNVPPIANFNASNLSGMPPLPVLLTDTSTGVNITAWHWDFGDLEAGNTSTLQNPPVHTYADNGTYTVNLTVTNDGGSSTKLQNISVNFFSADFTADKWSGLPNLEVTFTDQTLGMLPDSWHWDFGDIGAGNTSTLQNPTHTFVNTEVYPVNLTVINGTISSTKIRNIQVFNALPVADFTASNTTGAPPLPVLFTDMSTGANITVWHWDFGDIGAGNTSTLQNPPVHTYADNGTYTVNLTVTNDGGSSTKLQNITVSFFVSQYTASPLSGQIPLTVTFTETAIGKIPDSYYWEFGDGGTSLVQNPVHIYSSVGIYDVRHRIINQSETSWTNKSAYIYANQTIIANFTGSPTTEYLNPTTMAVSFTDTSTGEDISQWDWNFGDGTANATTQNPVHNYASIGSFNVFLKVNGADGNASTIKNAYITVNPLAVNFTANTTSVKVGDPILFTDTSLGHPNTWFWDFGDGSTSTNQNPIKYSYPSVGTYTVKFMASNGIETGWKNVTNMITVTAATPPAPVAAFNAIPTTAQLGQTIQFYDTSGNTPTSWFWNFGDGVTSTLKNPTHAYAAIGSYTVSLTATNAYGSDILTKPAYISIINPPAPTVYFSASPTTSYIGGTVQFTDQSLYSPTSWSWNFGDGVLSSLQNPTHIYTSDGTYTVSLTAANAYGSNILTKTGYITISSTVPTTPPTSYVITNTATAVSNNTVTMNGETISGSYKYYFEYGLYPGVYAYATEQKIGTLSGNFSETVNGLPLLADETYYYRAVINENENYLNGDEKQFTLTQSSPLDIYPEFETRGDALIEANWDFDTLLTVIPSPFVDLMGSIFYGIIIGGAYLLLWYRTHKIVIPAIFGILSGGTMFNLLPPSWVALGAALFYISIGCLLYGIIVGRQS